MAEVVGVHYDVNSLVVEVRDLQSDAHWQIAFPGVEVFRVLDEGDLGEFWGGRSRPGHRGDCWRLVGTGMLKGRVCRPMDQRRPRVLRRWPERLRERACMDRASYT